MSIRGTRKLCVSFCLASLGLPMAVEIGLRTFESARPSHAATLIREVSQADMMWFEPDAELGFIGRPSRRDSIETADYTYLAETDPSGFANPGNGWPANVDVVFLGDSLTTGPGVGLHAQFTTLIDDALPLSVLNLGMPGASPRHQLLIYRRFAASAEPAIVVSCLWVAADIENAKRFDAWPKIGAEWSYDEFRRFRFAELISGSSEAPSAEGMSKPAFLERVKRLVVGSAIVRETLYQLEPWRFGVVHEYEWPDGTSVFLDRRKQEYLSAGIPQDYPNVRAVFFSPLEEVRALVEARGARFAVALIPSKEELFAAASNPAVLSMVTEVRRELEDRGITVIDLYEPLRNAGEHEAPFFPYDIHLNETGNRVVAEAFIRWLGSSSVKDAL